MKKKFLFVGGKADGHMIEADERYSIWQVPYYTEYNPMALTINDDPTLMTFERENYRKIMWRSGDKSDFQFFALENLSNHEVMQMILNNYQPFHQFEENKKFKRYEIMLERCVKMLDDFIRSPFPTDKLMKNVYDLIYDVRKFLFKESNKN